MKTKKTSPRYMEWFDADEMHEHSKSWLSELSFIEDEQEFLKNLIHSFAVKPLDKSEFAQIDDFKKSIEENHRKLNTILKEVRKHTNQIEIMMDDVNQFEMEKAYKKTHEALYAKVNQYLLDYRTVKQRGFTKLSSILKAEKSKGKALGNPDYKLSTLQDEKTEP